MATMRRVISACVMVGLASSEAAPPSSCVASTEDPSSCITSSDDATNLMQQKIRVHKGKQGADAGPEPVIPAAEAGDAVEQINCRVIGATKLMTPVQTTAAANKMVSSGCKRVDWDGDGIKEGCFAEAIGKWKALILQKDPEDYASFKDVALPEGFAMHPHCAPTTPGQTGEGATGFYNGWGCDENIPDEDRATPEDIQEAENDIAEKLGPGANAKVGQYLRLAVADYKAYKPQNVFWLLEEDRCHGVTPQGAPKKLADWVSLAEFKGLADQGARWVIIDKCAEQVIPSAAASGSCTKLWNDASNSDLGWADAAAQTLPALSPPQLSSGPQEQCQEPID